jgi:hypothetical protein
MRLFFWDNPLFKKGLKWQARLNHLVVGTSYIWAGFAMPIFFLIPPWTYLTGNPLIVNSELEIVISRLVYFVLYALSAEHLYRGRNPGKQFQFLAGMFPVYLWSTIKALVYPPGRRPRYQVSNIRREDRRGVLLVSLVPQLAVFAANAVLPFYTRWCRVSCCGRCGLLSPNRSGRGHRERSRLVGSPLSWRVKISWPRLLVIGGWLTIVVLALYAKRGPFWRVDAGTLFERAVEATGQGNDQEAFGLLNQAIGRDSTQAGFLIAKGFTALRLDRPDTASRSFERALRHEPANPEATLGLAASLIRLNHLDSARTILREMDGLPMADSQTIRRARLLEAVDDPSGALDVYASIPSIENLSGCSRRAGAAFPGSGRFAPRTSPAWTWWTEYSKGLGVRAGAGGTE